MKSSTAAAPTYDGVKAAYHDRVNKLSGEVSWGRANDERKHTKLVKQSEKDAAKIHGAEPKTAFDHSADSIKTLRHSYSSKENAQRSARSEYLKLGRGLATFSITLARGRPELFPDVPVAVKGFKPAIDATDWIAVRVVHNLTDAGYTTAVELEMRATEAAG